MKIAVNSVDVMAICYVIAHLLGRVTAFCLLVNKLFPCNSLCVLIVHLHDGKCSATCRYIPPYSFALFKAN